MFTPGDRTVRLRYYELQTIERRPGYPSRICPRWLSAHAAAQRGTKSI
jgi:hypothetical protein